MSVKAQLNGEDKVHAAVSPSHPQAFSQLKKTQVHTRAMVTRFVWAALLQFAHAVSSCQDAASAGPESGKKIFKKTQSLKMRDIHNKNVKVETQRPNVPSC